MKRTWVVSDVHGAGIELQAFLAGRGQGLSIYPGAKTLLPPAPTDNLVLAGDMFDRAMDPVRVWQVITNSASIGRRVYCLLGNHERKWLRWLKGELQDVPTHYKYSWDQLSKYGVFKDAFIGWLEQLPTLLRFDSTGRWKDNSSPVQPSDTIVVHAGVNLEVPHLPDLSPNVYGDGQKNKGTPWWDKYQGENLIIYGHLTETNFAVRFRTRDNNIINSIGIDTGVAHGGPLTAYCIGTLSYWKYQSGVNWAEKLKGMHYR